jgi:hypothetical protein
MATLVGEIDVPRRRTMQPSQLRSMSASLISAITIQQLVSCRYTCLFKNYVNFYLNVENIYKRNINEEIKKN